jgi:glycine dehydrogenase subunit 2
MTDKIKKATRHTNQNEGLIFEKSSPGKRAFELPPLDVPAADPAKFLAASHRREGVEGFPEVSEIEVIRHFTRLSTWNYAIDLGMYPLGSCTMKYNPRVNEFVARLDGIATEHPYQPQELSQGCLKILQLLEKCLLEITGMDSITLQPAAGAQGEMTGLLLVRAYHEKNGNPRKKVLIPDSAHGTNPATAVIAGYEVENIKSESHGQIDVDKLRDLVTPDVAALMITNPSTLGIFEERIPEIAKILHDKGALLYMDGANMNALTGITRPGDLGVDVMHLNLHKTFSTPHGGGGPGAGPVAMAASKPSAEISASWSARSRTSSPTAPACVRPRKTPSSTQITFANISKAFSTCPIPYPRCTKLFSAMRSKRRTALTPWTLPSASSTMAFTRTPQRSH